MSSSRQQRKAQEFVALHAGEPFVIPNPWDAGSARMLEALGFAALGFAAGVFAAAGSGALGAATGCAVSPASASNVFTVSLLEEYGPV